MKFDRFLSKIFSRAGIFVLILLLVFSFFCMGACNACDVVLCLFCGCVTPETCFEICDCSCNLACGWACEICTGVGGCYNDCLDCMGYNDCVKGTTGCVGAVCGECITDENGEPLDCADVGCPGCQEFFDCDDCFSGESDNDADDGDDTYATDEEFYEWIDRNGY